jgi:hypothetical protein
MAWEAGSGAVVQAGIALDPTFTIARWRAFIEAGVASRQHFIEGMRLAAVPEG